MTLPGGFHLPVALVKYSFESRELTPEKVEKSTAQHLLSDFSQRYIKDQMIAGQILSKNETISPEEDHYILTGHYACYEMIGREQTEEIIAPYGKHD